MHPTAAERREKRAKPLAIWKAFAKQVKTPDLLNLLKADDFLVVCKPPKALTVPTQPFSSKPEYKTGCNYLM